MNDITVEQYNEIYDEGWKAGYDDLPPHCPYQENTSESKAWNCGYEQGSRDC